MLPLFHLPEGWQSAKKAAHLQQKIPKAPNHGFTPNSFDGEEWPELTGDYLRPRVIPANGMVGFCAFSRRNVHAFDHEVLSQTLLGSAMCGKFTAFSA
jgi:hypothetical protein